MNSNQSLPVDVESKRSPLLIAAWRRLFIRLPRPDSCPPQSIHRSFRTLVLVAAITTVVLALKPLRLAAADWPQWRGPTRDGQIAGPVWPDKLDTNHLQQVWRVELGPSYSGPIVSADRVFTTESKDKKFEVVTAFDRKTGKELWKAKLPAAGYATPATYSVNGRQYLVIACGGGKIGTKSGDAYVAFALPK